MASEEPDGQESDTSDQRRFDEQVSRGTETGLVILGGLGIFAALVISTIALVTSSGGNSTTTVIQPAKAAGGQTTSVAKPASLTGDALGKQLFVSGDSSTGAVACGSCHTMKAAGTTGTIGPNLDKELTADPASAALESTVSPNKDIATGYKANIMPKNYGTALTKPQLAALATYVYKSTNTKAKRASAASGTP